MSYREAVQHARRLAILLTLYFSEGYVLPRKVLRAQLKNIGFVVGMDLLANELAWLAEMGLLERLELDVVRLSERGEDVALGRSIAPGVRRPSVEEVEQYGA